MEPKYPEIEVQLTGVDSNAFNLIGIVSRALRTNKVPQTEIDAFISEATSGDYDNVLITCMKWVSVS